MSLPLVDPLGRVYVAVSGIPVFWNGGLGYMPDGRLCITTTKASTDVFSGGLRLTNDGRLVVGDGVPPARPYVFLGGLPTDKRDSEQGVVIRQVDTVPAASDPFVGGIRVGPLGGVYMTTLVPGLLIPTDLDSDGLLDQVLTAPNSLPAVSIDADSINIDNDGDNVADVVIPR